ncbi:N-acetyltransferase-like protein [Podospora appendiculata]|uniref:N-acetyltransferase-like protein n=1 Tax=Podospora appendiculata TaxID=314037 RepID=A0AAE1CH71_9PEZI|nr:N-acetyltransferase-like protein [Podospora appendiculata]
MTRPTSKPRIRIREATRADLSALLDVHFEAFDSDPMNQLMYPAGVTENARELFGQSLFPPESDTVDENKHGETRIFVAELLADDTADEVPVEIVAYAKWQIFRHGRPEAEWNTDDPPMTTEMLGEGVDADVYNAFLGGMHRVRKQHSRGDASVNLGILACRPTRQRLGAASALMRWGTELADELGLPSYLESSPYGYPVYKKFGYQDIDVLDLKITELWGVVKTNDRKWGEDSAVELAGPLPAGTYRSAIMKRPAKAASV